MSKTVTESIGQKIAADIQKRLKTSGSININIQITLPVSENEKVYENIFKAIKENLLNTESKTN